jgi:hypothetical protein
MDIAECSLIELMDDPLIGLVMRSDAVDRHELELLIARIARQRWPASAPANSSGPWLLTVETAPCSHR